MDSHIRSSALRETIAKIVIGLILFGLLAWGLSSGDAGATTFTSPPGPHLPPRPTLEKSCATQKCEWVPIETPTVAPAVVNVRIVPPTPIQWYSHEPLLCCARVKRR